jgi:hypothetical protein
MRPLEETGMLKNLFALLLCALLGCVCIKAAAQSTRKKLVQPTVIQGYSCDKGYAWFYNDGRLRRCSVSQETQFGEALIPGGSILYLKPDGSRDGVQLAHSTLVHEALCDGGGVLGPAEGSMVGFYPSGKLKICYLAKDQNVQGVPCAHGGILATLTGPDPGVYFYESGKLQSCRLAKDYGGLRKSTMWRQTP